MKRFFCIFLSVILGFSLLLTACVKEQITEITTEEPTSAPETTTEEVTSALPILSEEFTDSANPIPHKPTTDTTAPSQAAASVPATDATTQPVTVPSAPQIIDLSSKGYDIVQQDGFTYVNGVLIVNKTYSLPASYAPGGLTGNCAAAFSEMQSAAADEGLDLYVSSGFRSYSLQQSLYDRYCAADGKEAADTYSARPGHSEHQTGLAIDLNTIENSFADTPEGKWVAENCWKFGFILRYPAGKEAQTGYCYEPWHIRYLGVKMATAVYNSGLCLEEYLGITSEYQ